MVRNSWPTEIAILMHAVYMCTLRWNLSIHKSAVGRFYFRLLMHVVLWGAMQGDIGLG